jgi:hypothetical protein
MLLSNNCLGKILVILAYPYNPVFSAQAKLMHVLYALVHSAKVRLANWGFFWVVSLSLHGLPQYPPPPNIKSFIVHWLMCYSYLSLGTHEVVPQLRAKVKISHFGGDDRLVAKWWLEIKVKSYWKNTCSITINWDSIWASIVRMAWMHEVSACRQGWNTWLY